MKVSLSRAFRFAGTCDRGIGTPSELTLTSLEGAMTAALLLSSPTLLDFCKGRGGSGFFFLTASIPELDDPNALSPELLASTFLSEFRFNVLSVSDCFSEADRLIGERCGSGAKWTVMLNLGS